ncbi:MAG TPA: MFS transporter [Gemmataceae bacterium]|nr:MFS transporter [Gemmataceae bacterium]
MNGVPDCTAPLTRPTRARFVFLAYAAALSLLLYLDRICIAESAGDIAAALRLGDVQRGWMFTAFTVGYMLFEVPTGAWGDRHGPKRVLCRIVLWWSLFTVLTGCVAAFTLDSGVRLAVPGTTWEVPLLVNGFVLLLAVRFLFGAGEAGAYPNLAKSSGRWFPAAERGLAQGVVATAGRLGGGISSAVTIAVTGLVNAYLWPGMGWRATFWLFGLLGVGWVGLFARWFRNRPADHPAVNAAELALIEEANRPRELPGAGELPGVTQQLPQQGVTRQPPQQGVTGHLPAPDPPRPLTQPVRPAGTPWVALLTSVNLWAYSAAAFCSAFVVYLYFTRFPEYLHDRHHLDRERWGWVAGLPMVLGGVGCTLGGVLTDWLVRRTGSRRWGRRIMGLAGKGGGAALLLAGASVDAWPLAVALIALSAFLSDLALAAHWAVCTDAGGRFVATVFGIMNTVAAVGASLSPVLAGYLLRALSPRGADGLFDVPARQHAWDVVLYLFAATLAVSALCWLRIDAEESMIG